MGARRRCCCDCWFFFDNFFRDDSTNLGGNWNEVIGDWGIVGWELVENYSTGGGTANALLITTQEQPAATAGQQYMSLDIYDPQTGDIYYLYPCCTTTSSVGSLTATYECVTAPSQWQVTIGSETETMTVTAIDGWVQAICCVDDDQGMAKAWMNYGSNNVVAWDDACSPGTGRFSGCGHDNSSVSPDPGAIMDNYFVGELRTAAGVLCYDCLCRCAGNAPGKTLILTIFGAVGRYACTEGETCVLSWNADPTKRYWEGTVNAVGPNGVPTDIDFILRCTIGDSEYEGSNFVLNTDIDGDCCQLNPARCTAATATEASTCSPLSLVFGPYTATPNDLNCFLCYNPDPWGFGGTPTTGEFWVAVTE